MNTILAPYKGYAGFVFNGNATVIGLVEDKQQFDYIDGVQMFFGKTLAELNTTLEDSIAQ